MHLLNQLQVEGSYSPAELDDYESLELFSWHAFTTSEPPKEFLQLSGKVVTYCAGLPLALEILGAFLIKRSISEWKSTLELLKQIPNDDIQAKLQISFDALTSEQEDVFLDIACFFIGVDSYYVACILDGCNLYPDIVLSVLKERCLITISGNNIMMHDLLRDMGRRIVREKSPKNCGERSRLWNPSDVVDVLKKKSGTNAIEGLSLKAEVMDVQYFEVEAFGKMQELRLLQLSYVNLNGSYEHFPKDLRWLFWHGFSLEYFPTKLSLGSLVVLDLQYNNLKRFWEAQSHPQPAKMLKYLDLSHSLYLRETPDFSYFPNIEKLLLINCKSLVSVHKSIGILDKKLVLLNLSSCIELDVLPEDLYKLKSLETLILSNCSKLERLDDALGELESLTTLAADFTGLREIPSTINQLKKLKRLSLDGCKGILSCPAPLFRPVSFNGLSNLTTLSLAYCNLSDEMIPKDIESLSFLERLDLQGNNFCNLPTVFASLPNLDDLKLSDCSKLQSILSLPRGLKNLYVEKCISLKRIPDLSECPALYHLVLNDCINVSEIPGIHNHEALGIITMERCELGYTQSTMDIMLENWLKRNHECIYLPVDRPNVLPNWVCFKEEKRSFSFTVAETCNFDMVVGFTLWTSYQIKLGCSYRKPRAIMVKNLTRDGAWIHITGNSDIMKLNNLLTNGFHIETGDQMEVDVDCDDGITIVETGIALCYKAIDSSDLCEPDVLFYATDDIIINGLRLNSGHNSFHAFVHRHTGFPLDWVIPNLYACSVFPETSRYQEKNQPLVNVEENNHRPPRKMRMGLGKIFGAIGFLTLVVVGISFRSKKD